MQGADIARGWLIRPSQIICRSSSSGRVGYGIIKYPFKFNVVRLEDMVFSELVKAHWMSLGTGDDYSPILLFIQKLKSLRATVIHWEKTKKGAMKTDLVNMEEKLECFYTQN